MVKKYLSVVVRLFAVLVVLASTGLTVAKPAKAQGRTITLSLVTGAYRLTDSINNVATQVYWSNKSVYSTLINHDTVQWEFGDGTTLYLDFLNASLPVPTGYEDGNQLSFNTTGSYTLVSNLSGWTADNTAHIFKHWGTPCGGSISHTTAQSDLWHNFGDGTHAEAEWSGFLKYTPSGTCSIHIYYSLSLAGPATFRPSTTDAHYAQWPSSYLNCPFRDYPSDFLVKCSYANLTALLSHRVKLFSTPTGYTTGTPVTVTIFEKDSAGDYILMPGGLTGWTFN